ncbi:MAG: DinB family protein [Armatimonadota bacterium]|nr:DinB family protein [Armatimonadota bacterium]
MQNTIDQVKMRLLRAKQGLIHALDTTPDNRINWSPSPSSRTPIQQIAHAAWAVQSIHGTLDGRMFATETMEQADKEFREWEQQFSAREDVLNLLEQNCSNYTIWLDGLTPERFYAKVEMPFKLGAMPIADAVGFPADQIIWHTAQLGYIQTIYGDLDWHM